MSLLLMQTLDVEAQTALAVQEVRVVSTSGIVAAKSVDGKVVTIKLQNVAAGETPITARQGPGTTLATSAASNAVISIPSAGAFIMGPNTQVKLPKADETGHTLELLKGQLFIKISAEALEMRGGATFRLKTPAALLAVKGTRFFAIISSNGAETVGVHKGQVDVYEPTTKNFVGLKAGRAVSVSRGQIGKERPLNKDENLFQKNYELATTTKGDFTNSLGMKFVSVPETEILMCIHETRKQDWAAFAVANSEIEKTRKYRNQQLNDGNDHPVVCVSWNIAKSFCEWLSKKEGRLYRLPSDREWSHAVGIGNDEKPGLTPEELSLKVNDTYPWEGDWPPQNGVGNFADTSTKQRYVNAPNIEGYTDGFIETSPVMSFKPNKLGIYDLDGNVTEWCEDWSNDGMTEKVLRGANWLDGDKRDLNSSRRHYKVPTWESWDFYGFRCVLDVSDSPP